ncbi:MAG: CAP domain-containing protein [Gammaproteobacteria bacterium]|nr:CAP domain-containing protein [Gammaproteobacteria bacterium]
MRWGISRSLGNRSGFDPGLIESYIHNITNKIRIGSSLPLLIKDKKVREIAYMHSVDMSERRFFSHVNPDGMSPTDRANKAGYDTTRRTRREIRKGLGENILYTSTYRSIHWYGPIEKYNWFGSEEEIAERMMESWMNSKEHRENILNEKYRTIGVGVYIDKTETAFATQNFC